MKFRDTTDTKWTALFEAVLKADSRFFFRLAKRILRDGGAAEDACQHAFIKAWEWRAELNTPAALRAWLAKSVLNESLLSYRVRQRQIRGMSNHQSDTAGQSLQREDASVRVVSEDRHEAIVSAVGSLPELQRLIVIFRIMEGRSGDDTAEMVGCSVGEVSKQLRRGLARLRISLADWALDSKE